MMIAPAAWFEARVRKLRLAMERQGLDALIVTSLPNIAYLTGFFASAAAMVVAPDDLVLIGDGRYATALQDRAAAYPAISPRLVDTSSSYDEAIVAAAAPLTGLRVAVESAHLSLQRYRSILGRLGKGPGWSNGLVETDGVIEGLRLAKDRWEIGQLRDGASRLSDVAKCILLKRLAGRTESDVAAEIEGELRRAGFERPAFDTIVAAGPNAALPHSRASQRQIEPGELVLVDFGGVLNGYCTDLTRTLVTGPVTPRQQQLIERVAAAQRAAFEAVRPGGRPEEVDAAARKALDGFGLADAFSHGTGHGLGLEIHEGPRVTRARPDRAEPPLAPGMVMTLEPGVYFPGWGGVRIEDDVIVTEHGAEWLTDVPLGIGSSRTP
jgi:Xaa-Pro aminopeptidase